MCIQFNYILAIVSQNINLATDIYTLIHLNSQNYFYFFLFLCIGIGLHFLLSILVANFYFEKIKLEESEHQYTVRYYVISILMNTIPFLNFFIFVQQDENLYEIALFLDRLQKLLRLILINFMVIFFNVYLFFNNVSVQTDYYVLIPLLTSIFFSCMTLLNMHIFTYNQKVVSLFKSEQNNQGLIKTIKLVQEDDIGKFYQATIFLLFLFDYYGFSIMFGVFSQISNLFSLWYIISLLGIGFILNIMFCCVICCKNYCSSDKQQNKVFTFQYIDDNISVFCLPFGPFSLSFIYYIIKMLCSIGYFGFSLYFYLNKFTFLITIINNTFCMWIYISALGSLFIFDFSYPIFMKCFQKKRYEDIRDYKEESKNYSHSKV